MTDNEPDDRIIRERAFKRSSGVDIGDIDFENRDVESGKTHEEDEAIGSVFDPFTEIGPEAPGAVQADGSVISEPDRDLVTELSIEGEGRVNWILMVSMIVVYSAISIQVGSTFDPIPGTIALILLAAVGFAFGEMWVPRKNMTLLGITWVVISMKVLYGLAIELRHWGIIGSDGLLGVTLLVLVGANVYAAYRHDHDAIAAQSTLVLLAIGSTAGSILGEEGVAGMILLATLLLHGLALHRESGNLASLGIAASNLWIGMHAITSGFEITQLRVVRLDSPLLLFLLLMVVTALNATMAARFSRKENWFSSGFEAVGLGKPGLWGVSISLGMIGALLAVAANRDDLGYALGMVTFLGGAFGGSYLVVRGVDRERVSVPLLITASILSVILLAGDNVEGLLNLTSYQIFTILGAASTGFVILRDQKSVTDRVLWIGAVAILIMLVLLVPTESSEAGGDGGVLLLSLLSVLHIGTAILALSRGSSSLSGITVLLPWTWILLEEVIQEIIRTILLANDISDPGGIIDLDPMPLALYLCLASILLCVVNVRMGHTGVNLADRFLGITEVSASIRDSGVLQLWSLGLWLPVTTILFMAQFGGFTAITILVVLALLGGMHVGAEILGYRPGQPEQIMGILAFAIVVVQWRHGLDEVLMGILCLSIASLLFGRDDESRFTFGMVLMSLPILVAMSGREASLILEDSASVPNPGIGLAAVLCTAVLLAAYLPMAEKMEKIIKPATSTLLLLVLTIVLSLEGDDLYLEISSIGMFAVTSVWLIARGEIRAELQSIAKRDSILRSVTDGGNARSVGTLEQGTIQTFNPKVAEMRERRRKRREASETDDLEELLTTDVSHRPIVGLAVLAIVMVSTILYAGMFGNNQDSWPLFLIATGSFSSLIVLLVRNRTRGLELELPHVMGVEMPIALTIGGLVAALLTAHVIPPGSSNIVLLDMAVVTVLILVLVLISLVHQKNLLERIPIAIDWLVLPILTARILGSLVVGSLPMPLGIDPFEGNPLEWRGPWYLLESILIICVAGNFWIDERRAQLGRGDGPKGMGIGLRCFAIVLLSFGPAGLLAVLSASFRSWKLAHPSGLGLALPSGVLAVLAVGSWNDAVLDMVPSFVFILGMSLIALCGLTVPLRAETWTMTLAVNGHLFVVSGALAMGFIDEIPMPILLTIMSTVVWVVGILQLRKALRIWGLVDLITAILCAIIFVSSELSQPSNLLISLIVLAVELGIVAWLGLAYQEELAKD
ncbi:MAG: hypothetical protein QGH57_03765 [Candidatus Thalassarchaeaceae archaeon]|nr:hypothetical protein [Candidatus Thalassarchaeaceae archaeon]MDP7257129.1 hypothetical protein [Candidatus Thalassarchaeaceae archaeon]MDP7649699.1 hypothetical protein [Candidatus Thalassarchaeaceae archaeon]HJL55406.1 hypothetical protein [Candidatus Thalassarchaeaceae archaeon]HJM77283.1 hypothetical protein [Candidatus Thalassarchaeaceae archaeon]